MKMTTMLLALLLAGCAAMEARGPKIVEATERSVTVSWFEATVNTPTPLALAETHCAKYGRHAQFSGKPTDFSNAYNCVQ